jgi:hypothetical protein
VTDKPIARIRFATWKEFARFLTQKGAETGLFVRTAQPPPIGTELQIQLRFPDETALDLSARVSSTGSDGVAPGMGVVLTSMSAEEAAVLMNAIRRASARSPAPSASATKPAPAAAADAPSPAGPAAAAQHPEPDASPPVRRTNDAAPSGPLPAPRPVHAERFNEVFRLAAASKFDRAEDRVRQMLAEHPDDTEARIWQLVIQARRFRSKFLFEEAMEKYESVLMLDAAHEEARSELAALGAEAETSKDLVQRVFGEG